MGESESILVVDDDPAIGTVLGALLRQEGFASAWADSGEAALTALDERHFDAVLTDIKMPGLDGMGLLDRLSTERPDLPVVLLTAHGTVPMAVEAMKRGAADFLLKPFDSEEVLFVIRKALAASMRAIASPERAPSKTLVGASAAMREVAELVRRTARGKATVLIRGESGTGKELVARAVHDASPRSQGPFVKLHCAALPEALLESELFGYEKGAFTGAATRKPGRIELADGGTLFLDEIGDISLAVQVKLLRVLQEREFERLGGRDTIRIDVRFVAASHRDLESMVARGQFREDLFYRLNVVPFRLPALRERAGDIERLARHFCALHSIANRHSEMKFHGEALEILAAQTWPGNVRQLENFVERLVVLADASVITAADVQQELGRESSIPRDGTSGVDLAGSVDLSLETQRRKGERETLTAALARSRNNRTLAARLLGISRRTLYTKLEEHGLM
jgi:two-component system, NtrC family, response regulator AtoC